MAAVLPTATMWLPRIATACAIRSLASTVITVPFVNTMSGGASSGASRQAASISSHAKTIARREIAMRLTPS